MRWIVAFVVACGAAQHADDTPPCDAVADHLLELANRDNEAHAGPQLAGGIRAQLAKQCTDEQWTPERRRCLVAARAQDATVDCPAR